MEEINLSILNGAMLPPHNFMMHERDTNYLQSICVRYLDISENYIFYMGDDKEGPSGGKPECLKILKMSAHAMRYVPMKLVLDIFISQKYKSIEYCDFSGSFSAPAHPVDYITGHHRSPQNQTLDFAKRKMDGDKKHVRLPVILPPTLQTLNISNVLSWMYLDSDVTVSQGTILKTLNVSYNNIDNCGRRIQGLEHVTVLDISGVRCGHLYGLLADFPKLQKLTITNTPNLYIGIGDYSQDAGNSFESLHDLRELDLSGNKLTHMNEKLFISTRKLRSISLSNNKLQSVPLAIMRLSNISQLDLSINAFTHLTAEEMSLFDRFSEAQYDQSRFSLSLALNPFQCTCETLDFIHWIYSTEILLDLKGNYSCSLPNGSWVDFIAFKSDFKNFSVSCISHTWLIAGVVLISCVFVSFLLVYLIYRYRVNLRYWFYSKLKPPGEFLDQEEYIYDAFVAYSEDDYQWVIDHLHRVLEDGDEPLRLCNHKRDFTPGEPIHQNIVEKMRQSRKIIVVISSGFLGSNFGPTEIMYAGMKSLEVGREDIIVCILLEEIPVKKMPKSLRSFWHRMTFLKWSDDPSEQSHFRRQLRDAITPH